MLPKKNLNTIEFQTGLGGGRGGAGAVVAFFSVAVVPVLFFPGGEIEVSIST